MPPLFCSLSFKNLREANVARLPQFKDKHGRIAHSEPDGSDWSPAQWLQAVMGELGEYANKRKKFERGGMSFEEFKVEAAKELADVVCYLDILARRCLDIDDRMHNRVDYHFKGSAVEHTSAGVHSTGIDLGLAVLEKFNEISQRVGSTVTLVEDHEIGRVHVVT